MGLLESYGRGRRLLRRDELTLSPVITVHALTHAVAALTAAAASGKSVVLASGPGAGIYGGPGWWRELIAAARAAVPEAVAMALLDCGDDAGAAQAAIRAKVEAILFTGPRDVAERLADIASRSGCRFFLEQPAAALDLGAEFFASPDRLRNRCTEYLQSR
jgi:hypothetical protein